MTASTTLRHLTREARQQQRLKARLAAWWFVERCPRFVEDRQDREAHRVTRPLPSELRAMLAACERELSGAASGAADDTPTH